MPVKVSVIVCSRQPSSWDLHERNVQKTIGCPYEYIRIDNTKNRYGICAAYNEGVVGSRGEILIFVHEDVFFMEPGWGNNLWEKFSKDVTIGLVGLAGTQYLTKDSPAWVAAGEPYLRGRVVHETDNGQAYYLSVFSPDSQDSEVVAVDGLFFAIPRRLFGSIRFDEDMFDGFHFYDLDICLQVGKTHRLIVTWDVLVKHLSAGNCDEAWKAAGERFLRKYRSVLPLSCVAGSPNPAGKRFGIIHNLKGIVPQVTIA